MFWLDKSGGYPFRSVYLFSNPNQHNCSTLFMKMVSCTLGMGYIFVWYGLSPVCNYIPTALVSHGMNVTTNRKSYLDSRLCNALQSSSVNNFYYLMLHDVDHFYCSECPIYDMYVACRIVHIRFPELFMTESLVIRVCGWHHGYNIFHRGCIPFLSASIQPNCNIG